MIKEKVSAGIILYNPEINRLKDNVKAISPQVDTVYCFNNDSDNIEEIRSLIATFDNVVLIDEKNNLGISVALNRIAQKSSEDGYEWMLALDQDSVCPTNMISEFSKYFDEKKVGIICPVAIDRRRPSKAISKDSVNEVDDTITSGSLLNLKIYEKVGGSDEYLFVGLVDDEYCYRLRLNGYRILQVNSVVMDHELGELSPSKYADFWLKLGNMLHNDKIKALSYKRKVKPVRVYYATRNIIYLSNKYKNNPTYLFSKRFAIKNGLSNILRSDDKVKVIQAFIKGYNDGKSIK